MPDALARVTATLYRNDGGGSPAVILPWAQARVSATPVLLDETTAIIDSRRRVVGITDAAGVLWQTSPQPAEGALPGLSLAAGSWSWLLPDGETITATVAAGQVVDLLTLRGAVAPPGSTLAALLVPTVVPDGWLLVKDGTSVDGLDPSTLGVEPAVIAAAVTEYLDAHPVDADPAAAAIAAHEAALDPHPGYTTPAEAAAAAPVQSVAGRTGAVVLDVADVSSAVATTDPRLVDSRYPTAHDHTSGQITDFAEAVQDAVAAMLVTGANVTLSYDDAAGKLTVTAAGGDAEVMRDTIGAALVGANGVQVSVNDAADTITLSISGAPISAVSGLQTALDGKAAASHTHTLDAITDTATRVAMTPAERTKLSGVATGATANATDVQLRDRATHTGSQPISTITGLQDALDGKIAASIVDAKGDLIVATGADTVTRLPVGTTTGHALVVDPAEAAGVKWAPVSGGSGSACQVDIYYATGAPGSQSTYTWTKPAAAKMVEILAVGAGAGGGGGARGAAGTVRRGGGGGSAGGWLKASLYSDFLPGTLTIKVGKGGAGGTAATANDSAGGNGGNGPASEISGSGFATAKTGLSASGGGGGGIGTGGGGGVSSTGSWLYDTRPVGATSSTSGGAGASPSDGVSNGGTSPQSGSSGGGITTDDVASSGGKGTNIWLWGSGEKRFSMLGSGGNGGDSSISAAAGGGGAGLSYGGGGGGGGASLNGNNSGAGGVGGDGIVVVTTYF